MQKDALPAVGECWAVLQPGFAALLPDLPSLLFSNIPATSGAAECNGKTEDTDDGTASCIVAGNDAHPIGINRHVAIDNDARSLRMDNSVTVDNGVRPIGIDDRVAVNDGVRAVGIDDDLCVGSYGYSGQKYEGKKSFFHGMVWF